MPFVDREDLVAFVALWPRAYVPSGLVTEGTLKVLGALKELARDGGALITDELMPAQVTAAAPVPVSTLTPAESTAAASALHDDDIPF